MKSAVRTEDGFDSMSKYIADGDDLVPCKEPNETDGKLTFSNLQHHKQMQRTIYRPIPVGVWSADYTNQGNFVLEMNYGGYAETKVLPCWRSN